MGNTLYGRQAYVIRIPKDEEYTLDELSKWCTDMVQAKPNTFHYDSKSIWHVTDSYFDWIFVFTNKEHATLFSLTWSNYETDEEMV